MSETATETAVSSMFRPEFTRDPFPIYAALREGPPTLVTFPNGQSFWLVSRYQDVLTLFKDHRFTTDYTRFLDTSSIPALLRSDRSIVTLDGEDHARLRRLASQAFTPRFVEHMRTRVQQIADQLLDAVMPTGRMDLVNAFAYPLPMTVILEVLGVPLADRELCRRGSNALLGALNRAGGPPSDEQLARIQDFISYVRDLIPIKRAAPGDDLLSGLIQAHEQNDQLSEDELQELVRALIVAGHETTVCLISLGTLELLQQPALLERLRANPEQIPAAVEELLRLLSVATSAGARYATEDVELGGQQIRRGEILLPLIAAANHDPSQFPQPQQFDASRPANRHLALGHGAHYCLGAPLARLEAQIAFATLLRRLTNLRLSHAPDAVVWAPHWGMRSLKQLLVEFDI